MSPDRFEELRIRVENEDATAAEHQELAELLRQNAGYRQKWVEYVSLDVHLNEVLSETKPTTQPRSSFWSLIPASAVAALFILAVGITLWQYLAMDMQEQPTTDKSATPEQFISPASSGNLHVPLIRLVSGRLLVGGVEQSEVKVGDILQALGSSPPILDVDNGRIRFLLQAGSVVRLYASETSEIQVQFISGELSVKSNGRHPFFLKTANLLLHLPISSNQIEAHFSLPGQPPNPQSGMNDRRELHAAVTQGRIFVTDNRPTAGQATAVPPVKYEVTEGQTMEFLLRRNVDGLHDDILVAGDASREFEPGPLPDDF